jgi:DNA modification methylase
MINAKHTQEEIGKKVGLSQKQIGIKIKEIECFLKELLENPNSEILIKYQFLADKIKEILEFTPQLYNIWNKQAYDSDNQHFGKFPFTFMENLIYYYTKPFDVVFDPFAGGGTTIDVCKKWLRKYCVSDLNPIETRDDIPKHDIMKGLPEHIPSKINFVFLDPPYWRQAEEKYSKDKEDLGNMELDNFYESIEFIAKELKKKMKEGYVAFVISPTQWPNENKEFEDHIIKVINIFQSNGFKEDMRISLPYSSEQYNGTQVNIAKEKKMLMSLIRDLVVFKKETKVN